MNKIFEPHVQFQTAILFLVFNRPDTTAQVFEAIRKIKPQKLYVASDGPRANREDEAEKVKKVREIATAVDWLCEVKTLFRDENLGCKYAISGGITWFFEQEEQGIILEDDCLPSQSFFWFCETILNRYSSNYDVMAVTGTNIVSDVCFDHDYWFSNYALMWGWATWRRAWRKYDLELKTWPEKKATQFLKKVMQFNVYQVLTWHRILDMTYGAKVDTWDYQWIYTCWSNHGLTIAPHCNLIKNLGYSVDATHTKQSHPILSNLIAREMEFPLGYVENYEVNDAADAYISRHWFGVKLKSIVKSFILMLPGLSMINQFRKRFFVS